jgi:hypothetical protein
LSSEEAKLREIVREYSPENIKGTIVALPKRTRVSQQGQKLSPYLNGIGACFLTITSWKQGGQSTQSGKRR